MFKSYKINQYFPFMPGFPKECQNDHDLLFWQPKLVHLMQTSPIFYPKSNNKQNCRFWQDENI